MKPSKFLTPIRGRARRKKVLVYDIESKKNDTQEKGFTRPFLVGFFDGNDFISFRNDEILSGAPWLDRHLIQGGCIDKFMSHVLGYPSGTEEDVKRFQSKRAHIYAHNGGKFDHLFMLGWLYEHRHEFSFEITGTQSRIMRLDVWPRHQKEKEKGYWSFFDSISLLPMSLKKVAKTFCPPEMQKMMMDLDVHEADPSWEVYNEVDCKVLYFAMLEFHKLIEGLGGEVGVTAPATAMKLFRRRYLKRWIHRSAHLPECDGVCSGCERMTCDHTCHGCAHDWVRRGYYGGRTELFREHGRGLLYYDINSSYPASMLTDMPVGEMRVLDGKKAIGQLELMAREHIGFVECTVVIPKTCKLPPLPYRFKGKSGDTKLIFPTGTLSGVWSWDELQLLKHPLVKGKITKIVRSVWYKKRPIFKEMVNTLYAYRDKSDPDYNEGLSFCAKLMLNSLYGKFGMREERTGLLLLSEGEPWPDNGWPIDGDPHHCHIWEVERIANAPYIIPQISAHITALSRIRLFYGMVSVIEKGGQMYYTDTDSLMCDREVDDVGSKLGQWKQEEPGILLEGYFVLPKLYRLLRHEADCTNMKCDGCRGSIEKMKGVGSSVQNPENWKKIIGGGVIEFERVMQHRTMFHKKLRSPEVVIATKSIRTKYDKRILLKNGSTIPIHFDATG